MVEIRRNSRLLVSGLTPVLAERIGRENTFENPAYRTLERLGKWTGGTPRQLQLHRKAGNGLILPRGYFPLLVGRLKAEGVRFSVIDETICPEFTDWPEPAGALFDYQEGAVPDLLQYPDGVLEAPTGSGKTNILLSIVPRLRTRALILVHTSELLNQTAERAEAWLRVRPGIIGAGKFELRPLTVAMVQTLARRDLQASGIADYFGAVLIDECHHSPALTWARILGDLPARYRYGFTATAFRKDGLDFLIWRCIGNKTAKIEKKAVRAAGRIVDPICEKVETAYYHPAADSSEWSQVISDLVQDEERNSLIEREVRQRLTASTRALVLTDRIDHANSLADSLHDLEPVLLTGELAKVERAKAMERVRDGARLTVATVHLLGEGVDVPGWDLLFLVSPIAGGPRTLQAVGRVARPAPGKEKATVVDFVDSQVPILKGAWHSRAKLYAA